eukprot:gene6522-10530_t
MEDEVIKCCWKRFVNDKDGSYYYHNFITNEFSSEKKDLVDKKTEKKFEKFFRLNPVNINYLKICQDVLPDKYLNFHCSLIVNNEYSKENYKIFKEQIRNEIGKIEINEKIETEELNYSKFRQEANEYVKNWFKLKIKQ